MQPHQIRVVDEQDLLIIKTDRLVGFITSNSDEYKELPLEEKERLSAQLFHMRRYTSILRDRIHYFRTIERAAEEAVSAE